MKQKEDKKYKIVLSILIIMLISVLFYIFIENRNISKEEQSTEYEITQEEKPEEKFSENLKSEEKDLKYKEDENKLDYEKDIKKEENESNPKEKNETEVFFETKIKEELNNVEGSNSISFIDLNNQEDEVSLNSKRQRSASIIKLFIMGKAFDDIQNSKLSYKDVKSDLNLMIQKSDNEATNRIIDKLGMENINNFIREKGFNDTVLGRKMLDEKAVSQGRDNYTSSADVIKFFKQLNNDTLVKGTKDKMLEIMSIQERKNKIPWPLDEKNLKIYNKTGEYAKYRIENDCAIIQISPDKKYAIAILCEGGDSAKQINLIRKVSKEVFDFYSGLEKEEKNYNNEVINTSRIQKTICLDAGHQLKANYEKETSAPSNNIQKIKVTSGTQGVATKLPEYQFNLDLSKIIRDDLEKAGYKVVMVREINDVNLSNQQRAEIANSSNSDIYIRIHANGIDNPSVNGVETYYASPDNPDVGIYSKKSGILSKLILENVCRETGAKNRGSRQRDDLTGTNFANLPTVLLEAGYMSNVEEDKKLADPEYQKKISKGVVEAINQYFDKDN